MLAARGRIAGAEAHGPAAFALRHRSVGNRRGERELLRIGVPGAFPANIDTALEGDDGALAITDHARLTGYPNAAEDPRDIGRLDAISLDFEAVNGSAGVVECIEVCRVAHDHGRLRM